MGPGDPVAGSHGRSSEAPLQQLAAGVRVAQRCWPAVGLDAWRRVAASPDLVRGCFFAVGGGIQACTATVGEPCPSWPRAEGKVWSAGRVPATPEGLETWQCRPAVTLSGRLTSGARFHALAVPSFSRAAARKLHCLKPNLQRRWCPAGALPVLCVVRANRLERVEADVLIVSPDRLPATLRRRHAGTPDVPRPRTCAVAMSDELLGVLARAWNAIRARHHDVPTVVLAIGSCPHQPGHDADSDTSPRCDGYPLMTDTARLSCAQPRTSSSTR